VENLVIRRPNPRHKLGFVEAGEVSDLNWQKITTSSLEMERGEKERDTGCKGN
jgi:hypothetical protein